MAGEDSSEQITNLPDVEQTPRTRADRTLGVYLEQSIHPESFGDQLDRSIVETALVALRRARTVGTNATPIPNLVSKGFAFATMIESGGKAYLTILLPSDVDTRLAQQDLSFRTMPPGRVLTFAKGVVHMVTGVADNKLPKGQAFNPGDMRFTCDEKGEITSVPLPIYPNHSISVVPSSKT